MKTTRKLTKRAIVVVACACLMTMSVGILPALAAQEKSPAAQKIEQNSLPVTLVSKAYYQKHPTTAETLEKRIGKPVSVETQPDGSEVRYYSGGSNTMNIGDKFYIIKDGYVVGGNLSPEMP